MSSSFFQLQTLHYSDRTDCQPHLSQFAFEFLYVLGDVEWLLVTLALHPRVVYYLLHLYPRTVINRQKLSYQVLSLQGYVLPIIRIEFNSSFLNLFAQVGLVV